MAPSVLNTNLAQRTTDTPNGARKLNSFPKTELSERWTEPRRRRRKNNARNFHCAFFASSLLEYRQNCWWCSCADSERGWRCCRIHCRMASSLILWFAVASPVKLKTISFPSCALCVWFLLQMANVDGRWLCGSASVYEKRLCVALARHTHSPFIRRRRSGRCLRTIMLHTHTDSPKMQWNLYAEHVHCVGRWTGRRADWEKVGTYRAFGQTGNEYKQTFHGKIPKWNNIKYSTARDSQAKMRNIPLFHAKCGDIENF